jgi:hypothetical protein
MKMGARLVKFDFVPKENEQIEAVIRIPEEKRSVIHGIVKDWRNKVVKDAVVKLFEVVGSGNSNALKPITHTFTDEYGQFLFGPLCAYKKYVIKVWFDDVRIRELVITPDDEDNCDREDNDDNSDGYDNKSGSKREVQCEKNRDRRPDRRYYKDESDEEDI